MDLPVLPAQARLRDEAVQHPLHHLDLRVPGRQHLVPEFPERLLVQLPRRALLRAWGDAVEAPATADLLLPQSN